MDPFFLGLILILLIWLCNEVEREQQDEDEPAASDAAGDAPGDVWSRPQAVCGRGGQLARLHALQLTLHAGARAPAGEGGCGDAAGGAEAGEDI